MKHYAIKTTKNKKKIENKKKTTNNVFKSSLFILSAFSLFFSIMIILVIFGKGADGFVNGMLDLPSFLFGDKYDGVALFAAGFMVINTLWTSLLAVLVALPISIFTALFITKIAPRNLRTPFFVILSLLAAIPSVVYGAFGSFVVDWLVMHIFGVNSGTVLSIVVTLAFMIMPTITMITVSSINNVDSKMEHSSLALGATKNQTSFYITLRAASAGILTATILGVGRALGEATAVSMISSDPYFGPTFGLFDQIRLLTSTMLKGYNELEPGSVQEASMFAMSTLLIITIIAIFFTMGMVEKKSSNAYKAKVASKKINSQNAIKRKVQKETFYNVDSKTQRQYLSLQKKTNINLEIEDWYSKKASKELILNKTTVSRKTNEDKKQLVSRNLSFVTIIFSMLGVLFLGSIITYLLVEGSSSLSWEYISTSNTITIDGIEVNGLRTAILGTFILILTTMLFTIPLGVGTGVYFSQFAKNNWLTRLFKSSIDLLSGMPSLIFGIIGAVVFLPLANAINFAPLAAALILTFIVLPTVIKTTQEAIEAVPKSHVTGSLALGSTKTTSSLRVVLPQAMPQIISGLVLAIGRIIGESAAIVMVFGTVARDSLGSWTQYGGTTLATEMYRLTLLDVIPWNLVAGIGLVILSLIFTLSLLSTYISQKDGIGMLGIIVSIVLLIVSIYISNEIVFILGVFVLGWTIILNTLKKAIIKKNRRIVGKR